MVFGKAQSARAVVPNGRLTTPRTPKLIVAFAIRLSSGLLELVQKSAKRRQTFGPHRLFCESGIYHTFVVCRNGSHFVAIRRGVRRPKVDPNHRCRQIRELAFTS